MLILNRHKFGVIYLSVLAVLMLGEMVCPFRSAANTVRTDNLSGTISSEPIVKLANLDCPKQNSSCDTTLVQIPTFDGDGTEKLIPPNVPGEGQVPILTPPIPINVPINKPIPIPVERNTQFPSQGMGFLSSSYILGPGDQIQITVFDYDEFNGSKVILPDGTIAFPLVGSVMAGNRTIPDLTREVTIRLKKWVTNPVVAIALTKPRPLRINVAGEVQRPGPLQLGTETVFLNNAATGSINSRSPTVSGALLGAGGVTRNADLRQVVLKRYSPTGNSPTIIINLWDAIVSNNVAPDPVLQDGDSIFVPRLEGGESLDRRLLSRSSIAPTTVRVRVVGEVKKPGELEVTPNSSLSSAVAIAGGPTDKAKLSQVQFIRLKDDGTIEQQVVDLTDLNDIYQIQDGDVILVPKGRTSTALDFAIDLVNPLNFLVNLYRAITGQ